VLVTKAGGIMRRLLQKPVESCRGDLSLLVDDVVAVPTLKVLIGIISALAPL
jgi:hypothetical protein